MKGHRPGPTGAQLAAARKAAGLSQTDLARKAQIGRDAVSYWECKATVDPRGWAVRMMANAEPGIANLLRDCATNTHTRGMGLTRGGDLQECSALRARAKMGLSAPDRLQGFVRPQKAGEGLKDYPASYARARDGSNGLDALLEAAIASELIRAQERAAQRLARLRVICEAKTTRKGTPCRNKSEPGKRRCKFHGGRSTGPRTTEGKAAISEAQRARWARWREERAAGLS